MQPIVQPVWQPVVSCTRGLSYQGKAPTDKTNN